MAGNQVLLFVIVGRNEPLYEAEFHKRGSGATSSDATTRQNYFVLHSALDLVERSAWTTNRMHLGVIDKVRSAHTVYKWRRSNNRLSFCVILCVYHFGSSSGQQSASVDLSHGRKYQIHATPFRTKWRRDTELFSRRVRALCQGELWIDMSWLCINQWYTKNVQN